MTRTGKFNILISRPEWFLSADGSKRLFGPAVVVRYSYSDPTDEEAAGRETGRRFAAIEEVFDREVINSSGRPGAFKNVYPINDMRAYVAQLRAAWGDLHVQDNTGLLPDLDQGMLA